MWGDPKKTKVHLLEASGGAHEVVAWNTHEDSVEPCEDSGGTQPRRHHDIGLCHRPGNGVEKQSEDCKQRCFPGMESNDRANEDKHEREHGGKFPQQAHEHQEDTKYGHDHQRNVEAGRTILKEPLDFHGDLQKSCDCQSV